MDFLLLLKFIAIPFISGFVGWFTNVIALKMTFFPINFVGIKKWNLGWQGIIPSKAPQMAEKAVDIMTEKLIKIEDVFSRIEPQHVAQDMEPGMRQLTREVVDETLGEELPLIWETSLPIVKNQIYKKAAKELPEAIADIMTEIKENITSFFDLKRMVVEALENNRPLLNKIFLETGEKEFIFIERSGFYFGFLFGIIQAFLFWLFPTTWWILPVAGLFVGWATNWLALKMIFLPEKPVKVLFWTLQGMFIKRQKEVSKSYAAIISREILTPENIFDSMLQGAASDKLIDMIAKHIKESVDEIAGLGRPLLLLATGSRKYVRIKSRIAARFLEELPASIRNTLDYAEDAMAIESSIAEKMSNLSPEDFAGFLRPIFQEDEAKLIAVGAALGTAAGFAQLLLLF